MKIQEIKRAGFISLKGKWGFAVLLCFILFWVYPFIPYFVEALFSGGVNPLAQNGPTLSAQLISWIFTIALCPIIYGCYSLFLDMVRKKPAEFKNLFAGFEAAIYFKVIGIYLLTGLYTLLWSLLLIIPGIIKYFAYSQTYFILKDNPEISPNEAIHKSRQLMNGHKYSYFLLLLSFLGWFILGILTLFILFIWIIPYYYASLAAFYERLTKKDAFLSEGK